MIELSQNSSNKVLIETFFFSKYSLQNADFQGFYVCYNCLLEVFCEMKFLAQLMGHSSH